MSVTLNYQHSQSPDGLEPQAHPSKVQSLPLQGRRGHPSEIVPGAVIDRSILVVVKRTNRDLPSPKAGESLFGIATFPFLANQKGQFETAPLDPDQIGRPMIQLRWLWKDAAYA